MMRFRWTWVLPAALAVAACSSPPPKGDAVGAGQTAGMTSARAPITLTPVKWSELESAVASHKGKVVVLDVWAEF